MIHQDHVRLIKKAIDKEGGVWADLGSGDGAFTLALRDLAGPTVEIYSVDQNAGRLQTQESEFVGQFPDTKIHFLNSDFTKPIDLPKLDGILMANSLHYVEDQVPFLRFIKAYLKPSGKLVLVEYNADSGNMWVPYPLSFSMFTKVAREAGFQKPHLIATIPSSFLHEIYAAECH
jgi:ubiquinone/menaquinone biosynthesis C-methylase UbiE